MKIRVMRDVFANILSASQGILEKKQGSTATVNYLYFEANVGNKVITKATNYELSFYAEYDVEVIESGSVLMPGKNLHDIIKEFPEGSEVTVSTDDNERITVECKQIYFKINGLSASQFPPFPAIRGDFFTIPSSTLRRMIDKVAFASSPDATRSYLNGIYFSKKVIDGNRILRMVATDGHRLSLIDQATDNWDDINIGSGVILPRKGIQELRRLLELTNRDIQIAFLDSQMIARDEESVFFLRLIEGEFPDYEMVIPKNNNKVIAVEKNALASALRRMSLLTSTAASGMSKSMQFRATQGKLSIYAKHHDIGEAREEVEALYDGEELNIGFNGKYMLDILNVIDGNVVHIKLSDGTTAGLVQEENFNNHINIIMPVRI